MVICRSKILFSKVKDLVDYNGILHSSKRKYIYACLTHKGLKRLGLKYDYER